MESIEGIGVRIKFLREKYNLSQAAFAKRIDVSAGNVGDWESAKKKSLPGAKAIHAISCEFGVSADWLITGKEYIGTPLSDSDDNLTQSDKDVIDTIVEESRVSEPQMAKHVMENVVSWLKNETSSTPLETGTLSKIFGAAASLFGEKLIIEEKPVIAEAPSDPSIKLSEEEEELLLIFRSLSDRDAIEIMTIARMKKDFTQGSVKRGASSKSTSKTESVNMDDPKKKHA